MFVNVYEIMMYATPQFLTTITKDAKSQAILYKRGVMVMKKKRKSKFWFIVIALILLYSGYISVSLKGLLDSKKEQHADLENKITLQKKQGADLEKQMKNVNSDEYIEKMAREELGMVKKNERVYIDVNR